MKRREVKSYTSLNNDFVEWIDENTIKLLHQRNESELKAGEELKRLYEEVHEQVYFMINGRSYFLDYYLPKAKIAIEIDGGYHKSRRTDDKVRDTDFKEIGIRTIRIKDCDVTSGLFLRTFHEKVAVKRKTNHRKKKETKKQKESKLLSSARLRLRQHDKMKHLASWI